MKRCVSCYGVSWTEPDRTGLVNPVEAFLVQLKKKKKPENGIWAVAQIKKKGGDMIFFMLLGRTGSAQMTFWPVSHFFSGPIIYFF